MVDQGCENSLVTTETTTNSADLYAIIPIDLILNTIKLFLPILEFYIELKQIQFSFKYLLFCTYGREFTFVHYRTMFRHLQTYFNTDKMMLFYFNL